MTNGAKTVNGELQRLDLTIDRWESRLKRAFNTLDKLKRKRKRLTKIAFAGPAKAEHKPQPVAATPPAPRAKTPKSKPAKPAEIKATPIDAAPELRKLFPFGGSKRRRTPDDLRTELDARKKDA